MTIEQWVEENVKPNVLTIHKINSLPESGIVKQYDVYCLVTTEAGGTNIVVQPVNEINGEFYLGNRIVKNYIKPKKKPKHKEVAIKEAFEAIKAADPEAKYIGLDTSNDLTIVKLKVDGVVKGYSLLGGSLVEIEVG